MDKPNDYVSENDRAALEAALSKIADLDIVRMARISNTLHLESLWVSKSLLPELAARDDIEINETPLNFTFSQDGRLLPFPFED